MVWHGQRAESRAQRRLAGDRRGCCCHYKSDDCDRRRFLRVSFGGGTLRAASSIRCVHREESHSGPQKRREHGRIHSNFRGDVLSDARALYTLARDPEKVEPLRQAMRREFLWRRPPSCPRGLPLYLLKEGDCRALAASVSCGQDIAGDGAFSLGMIADYMDSLVTYGAAFYRNLYWEAGLVGQVLYLEAEEASIRSTGIGCYFDDPVHEVFGISSRDWQSFYHFTVGGPVEDKRLTTLPAYKLATMSP